MQLLSPLNTVNPEARRLLSAWYNKGIVNWDEDIRRDASQRLIPMIPATTADREMMISMLRGAKGGRSDVRGGLRRMAEELPVPLGVVPFTWTYMPDGRAVSWPAGFYTEVVEAARELGLPLFEPHQMVMDAGINVALKPDRQHYAETFMPRVAIPLIGFTRSIVRPRPAPAPSMLAGAARLLGRAFAPRAKQPD